MSEKKDMPKIQWIYEQRKLLIFILLFFAVLAVCILYIRRTTVPLECYEIGPASDPARWVFTLDDGTVLQPKDGALPIQSTNTVVICETVITGTVLDKPLLVVNANSSDCVFLLDGKMIYSASGRYSGGAFDSSKYEKTSASGQFGLPELGDGKRLTMIVQFSGEENRLSRMPKLTLYPEVINYQSQHMGAAARDALPAGVYFTVALFLAGLFLIGLWKRRSDTGLILLAVCALSMAFQRTASYSYGVMRLVQSPTVTWFSTTLPQAAMSWLLWYRLSRRLRRFSLLIPGATTAAIIALLIIGLDNLNWVKQMHVMTAWIIPAAVLIMLLAAAVDAVKGNQMLRRLFRYLAWAIPVAALCWVFSLLTGGSLAQSLKTAFSSITGPNPILYYLCGLLCSLLLILCFIQAILELISNLARQDAEMQSMALREQYAVDNMEIMRQSQEETRRQWHEMQHHLTLLQEMLSQEQNDRATEYVQSLLDQVAALPSGYYSDNMVVNAIAGYYLNMAKMEGIRVEADIKAEENMPLKDEELCVLLTNLLENAVEASRSMGEGQDRFLSLRISSNQEHVLIVCENSTDAQTTIAPDGTISTSKSDAENHGYGISSMRRIVEKRFGVLEISCADGRFKATITI